MSDASARLRRLIALKGPLSLAEFMTEALWHPGHGYYAASAVLGADGDFVTAPEISQMFGELLGLWAGAVWLAMGRPAPLQLIELGPGRGLLMADAWRALGRVAGFQAAALVHLVETSPRLEAAQRARLAELPAAWHRTLGSVPAGPAILLANEFLDALPILQLERTADGWRERLVDCEAASGRFRFTLAAHGTAAEALLSPMQRGLPVGSVVELSPAAISLASALAARLVAEGGAALLIDYGSDEGGAGATLQAVRGHAKQAVLEAPGSADLSAHVDFAAIARAAREAGAACYGPIGQGAFLLALGIRERAERLAAAATPAQGEAIRRALERLTAPDAMGTLFRVLALAHPALPAPPGFEAAP